MSHESDEWPPEKRHVGGELVIPIAGLLFTLYYFSTILNSPWTAQISAFFIGAILIALTVAYLVKTMIEYRAGLVDMKMGALAEPAALLPKRLILFGLTLGYIYVIHLLGFTLTTFVFMAASMALLSNGRRLGFVIMLSAIVALAGWALFILAFDTRFPLGPFEWAVEALI